MIQEHDTVYDAEDKLSRTTEYVTVNGQRQFSAEYEYIYE